MYIAVPGRNQALFHIGSRKNCCTFCQEVLLKGDCVGRLEEADSNVCLCLICV